MWIVGAGVGKLGGGIFLALCGFRFDPLLIDMDFVKIHNLDRSPVFIFDDLRGPKVDAVKRFLATVGITAVVDPTSFRRSMAWQTRQAGVPDIGSPRQTRTTSATTSNRATHPFRCSALPARAGRRRSSPWYCRTTPAAAVCSPEKPADTECATDKAQAVDAEADSVDAALPFRSFAAGLMTAIEIAKLGLPERPPSNGLLPAARGGGRYGAPGGAPAGLRLRGALCNSARTDGGRRALSPGLFLLAVLRRAWSARIAAASILAWPCCV